MVNVDAASSDISREAEASSLNALIARNLQMEPRDVKLQNPEAFLKGHHRFLYGFTEPPTETSGFLKLARTPENSQQLRREDLGLGIARVLGIPTVGTLHPFQNTPEGYGLLHVEKLDPEKGIVLTSPQLIAGADPVYGARAARELAKAGGRVIPPDIDSSLLKRGDERNQSAETFWGVWETQNKIVFAGENVTLVDTLIGSEKLHTIVSQARTALASLVDSGTNPNVEYFVHNDTSPNNMFFNGKSDQVTLLDFEHAGATHNLTLAQLTDLGNFYGRMWPNPEMQQQFLTAYLAISSPDLVEHNYQLLRGVAVFGAMFLSQFAMQPTHPEHLMALSLIANLATNLSVLEQQYNAITTPTA